MTGTIRPLFASSLAWLLVSALPGCAVEGAVDTEEVASADEALTSTVGFHRFSGSGGAEVTAWGDKLVVTDVSSVATYAQDPATTPGIRNGTIGWTWSESGSAFVASTSGSAFTPLLPKAATKATFRTVRAASAAAGKLFFVSTPNWTTFALERQDSLSATPVTIATAKAYGVVASDDFVFTVEPGAAKNELRVVRRDHDGADARELGTLPDGSSFLGLASTYAATGAYFYAIARGTGGVVSGLGPSGPFELQGPKDSQATLAAAGDGVFVAADTGLWRATAGTTTATLVRSASDMARDAGLPSARCGMREEYGRNAAFTADANGVYVVCKSYSPDRHVLLDYRSSGSLRRAVELPAEWAPLGRLTVTPSHYCAMQQTRYHSSPKSDQLRCFRR